MKELLVEYLICPRCSKNFVLKTSKKIRSEIIEGELICEGRHRFPINGGIPRLVVDKSKTYVKTQNSFSSKIFAAERKIGNPFFWSRHFELAGFKKRFSAGFLTP